MIGFISFACIWILVVVAILAFVVKGALNAGACVKADWDSMTREEQIQIKYLGTQVFPSRSKRMIHPAWKIKDK